MNIFASAVGGMIMLIAAKPAVIKSFREIRRVRATIRDLERRRRALSQQLRVLARESLNQRALSAADARETETLSETIDGLQGRLDSLQSVDRRIIVMDERRGVVETSWIILIRRAVGASAPPNEPPAISQLWRDGRYYHFFATDEARARRKAGQLFPASGGYEVQAVHPYDGDLSQVAKLPGAPAPRS